MEKIEEYLYHGTDGHYVEFIDDKIDIFSSILKENIILNINGLVERNIIKYPKSKSNNELDTVSVAFHKNNSELYERYKKELHAAHYECAWQNYFHSPTFVIDPIILEKIGVKISNPINNYCGIMPDELLIKDSIPLEYLRAIGIRIRPLGSLTYDDYYEGISEEQYYYIKETMKKYNLDIPLVYLDTGEEINDKNKSMIKKRNRYM